MPERPGLYQQVAYRCRFSRACQRRNTCCICGHPAEKGFQLAREVDLQGRAIVLTTTKEHAELKRDQIHAFGADRLIARSKGSMSASIEAEK